MQQQQVKTAGGHFVAATGGHGEHIKQAATSPNR